MLISKILISSWNLWFEIYWYPFHENCCTLFFRFILERNLFSNLNMLNGGISWWWYMQVDIWHYWSTFYYGWHLESRHLMILEYILIWSFTLERNISCSKFAGLLWIFLVISLKMATAGGDKVEDQSVSRTIIV